MMPVSTVSEDKDQEVSIKIKEAFKDLEMEKSSLEVNNRISNYKDRTINLKGNLIILSMQQHDGVEWDPNLKEGSKLTQDSVVKISIRKGSQPGYADLTIGAYGGREYIG